MKVLRKAGWYWRRLRVMPLAEIPWRVQRSVKVRCLAAHYRRATAPSPRLDLLPQRHYLLADDAPAGMPQVPVDDWLANGFPLFELQWSLTQEPDWFRDPKTGVVSPRHTGFFLDYRDESLVGDIKYLWEPARFHACVPLAQAWRASRNPRYLDAIALQLDSFLAQCPCPVGVHWSSALEHAIRLLNWALLWELTGGRESPLVTGEQGQQRLQRWLASIYWHQHFIHHYYAAYSSANNHLIGEAAGVFVASAVWPLWPESAQWQQRAREILERECIAQNHADGVNAEQALCYQQFVWDFLYLPYQVANKKGQPFSAAYGERLHRMLVFLAALKDGEGCWPQLGDADEGLATGLSVAGVTANHESILASGAVQFSDTALAHAGRWDDKAACLNGEAAHREFLRLQSQPATALPVAFAQGGYYRLGDHQGLCAWMDIGPLGMGALAAHGHADALHVLLWAHGRPVLVDPGTYAYHTQQRWRDYFRGTRAHNTITVDDQDQSVIGGNFLWMEKANAYCLMHDAGGESQRVSGYHDGYQRLPDPLRHERELQLDRRLQCLQITDRLLCEGEHAIQQCWHFDPRWQPVLVGDLLTLDMGETLLTMQLDGQLEWSLHRGHEDLPAGWYSRRLDQREPCSTLIGLAATDGDSVLVTRISLTVKETS